MTMRSERRVCGVPGMNGALICVNNDALCSRVYVNLPQLEMAGMHRKDVCFERGTERMGALREAQKGCVL